MELYELLIEKGKQEGIVKNVVGAIILNEKNQILIMSRKTDDFMGGIVNFLVEIWNKEKIYIMHL